MTTNKPTFFEEVQKFRRIADEQLVPDERLINEVLEGKKIGLLKIVDDGGIELNIVNGEIHGGSEKICDIPSTLVLVTKEKLLQHIKDNSKYDGEDIV